MRTDRTDGREKVLVAMSGGVDSSVAALLLARAGYEVHGVSFQFHDGGGDARDGGGKRCCSLADVLDAARVADRVGIPFEVADLRAEFRRAVVDDFVSAYREGRTPNPCVRCNERVKFPALAEEADRLGIRWIATGHYARTERGADGETALLRAADRRKDQSYALYAVGRPFLRRLLLPLGELDKSTVRGLAKEAALPVASKPESQDICFVPSGDYAAFLESKGLAPRLGEVVDLRGTVLGRHGGIHRFTVGQRKGIGVAAAAPLHVLSVDPRSNRVVVGTRSELPRNTFLVEGVTWIGDPPDGATVDLSVVTRYRRAPAEGRVTLLPGGKGAVAVAGEGEIVAPGQAAVFYRGERVLGGGWIARLGGGWIAADPAASMGGER